MKNGQVVPRLLGSPQGQTTVDNSCQWCIRQVQFPGFDGVNSPPRYTGQCLIVWSTKPHSEHDKLLLLFGCMYLSRKLIAWGFMVAYSLNGLKTSSARRAPTDLRYVLVIKWQLKTWEPESSLAVDCCGWCEQGRHVPVVNGTLTYVNLRLSKLTTWTNLSLRKWPHQNFQWLVGDNHYCDIDINIFQCLLE
jgi:hypothetical protein